MSKIKKNKKTKPLISDDVIKAIHKGGRELQRELNGGLQFVATHKVFKNKKKYNRKDNKKRLSKEIDSLYSFKTYSPNY